MADVSRSYNALANTIATGMEGIAKTKYGTAKLELERADLKNRLMNEEAARQRFEKYQAPLLGAQVEKNRMEQAQMDSPFNVPQGILGGATPTIGQATSWIPNVVENVGKAMGARYDPKSGNFVNAIDGHVITNREANKYAPQISVATISVTDPKNYYEDLSMHGTAQQKAEAKEALKDPVHLYSTWYQVLAQNGQAIMPIMSPDQKAVWQMSLNRAQAKYDEAVKQTKMSAYEAGSLSEQGKKTGIEASRAAEEIRHNKAAEDIARGKASIDTKNLEIRVVETPDPANPSYGIPRKKLVMVDKTTNRMKDITSADAGDPVSIDVMSKYLRSLGTAEGIAGAIRAMPPEQQALAQQAIRSGAVGISSSRTGVR